MILSDCYVRSDAHLFWDFIIARVGNAWVWSWGVLASTVWVCVWGDGL